VRAILKVLALAAPLLATGADAQQSGGAPPHEWLFGTWTGGLYPASDTDPGRCFGQPVVIFTRDVVFRQSILDVAYRQRLIETAAGTTNGGVEFRFSPIPAQGGRLPADVGFGCENNPNLLRVERRGENEIVFPNCSEFPSPLRRCTTR